MEKFLLVTEKGNNGFEEQQSVKTSHEAKELARQYIRDKYDYVFIINTVEKRLFRVFTRGYPNGRWPRDGENRLFSSLQ